MSRVQNEKNLERVGSYYKWTTVPFAAQLCGQTPGACRINTEEPANRDWDEDVDPG